MTGPSPSEQFGKYLLVKRVAVGGMAELFLAVEDSELSGARFVIVKRIRPEHVADEDYIEFFLTEGRVAIKCCHPSLPQAFELGVIDGSHYLAMEYIHGHTLLDVVNAASQVNQRMSISSVLAIGIQVAAGLEHLHTLRDVDGTPLEVVHRDVTPQNVMLSHAGAVKLIDLGIVRSALQIHKTRTGVVKGKFSYLAPEVLERGRVIDQRADLFGLGIVLHEALTGRSLFRGRDDSDTMRRLKTSEIPNIRSLRRDVPDAVADVIGTALRRDPEARFQTATEFLVALERAAEQAVIPISVTSLRREVTAVCGQPPWPLIATAGRVPGRRLGSTASARTADSKLAYFLDRVSTATPPPDAPAASPSEPDAEFDQLLSRLDS